MKTAATVHSISVRESCTVCYTAGNASEWRQSHLIKKMPLLVIVHFSVVYVYVCDNIFCELSCFFDYAYSYDKNRNNLRTNKWFCSISFMVHMLQILKMSRDKACGIPEGKIKIKWIRLSNEHIDFFVAVVLSFTNCGRRKCLRRSPLIIPSEYYYAAIYFAASCC